MGIETYKPKEEQKPKFDLDEVPIRRPNENLLASSKGGFSSSSIFSSSFEIPGSKYGSQGILESSQMCRFLSYVKCDSETAKSIIDDAEKKITSNSNCILNQKGLPVSASADGQFIVPLSSFMGEVAANWCRLEKFLNITQNDVLVLAGMESAFSPNAQSYMDVGLFQINQMTVEDLQKHEKSISKNMKIAGAIPFTLKDIGVTVQNYQIELKKPEKAMAVFILVLYRKLSMALADSRNVTNKQNFTTATKYGTNAKKRNLWYGLSDPRKSGNYKFSDLQKRYFFSDYYNANGKLAAYQIDYGVKYLSKLEDLEKKSVSGNKFASAEKKKKVPPKNLASAGIDFSSKQKSPTYTSSKQNSPVNLKKTFEDFSELLKNKYSQTEGATKFWIQNFENKQIGLNKTHDSKLYSVMDLLNPSVEEMDAILSAVWDISKNKTNYAFDEQKKWVLYDNALTFDSEHFGSKKKNKSKGEKKSFVRWFVRSLQTSLNGGAQIEGDKGVAFRLILKAAQKHFKRLPDGGKSLMERIRKIDRALTDTQNKLYTQNKLD